MREPEKDAFEAMVWAMATVDSMIAQHREAQERVVLLQGRIKIEQKKEAVARKNLEAVRKAKREAATDGQR